MRTLRSVAGIEPAHIALEPLVGDEEGIADEASQLRLYEAACERLVSYGFEQYAVGRFARDERRRETFARALGSGAEPIGLGVDARSCFGGIAYVNTPDFAVYIEGAADPRKTAVAATRLDDAARARLFVRNRLAYGGGFEDAAFERACGAMSADVVQELEELERDGLLSRDGGTFRLTRRGTFSWAR